MSKRIYIEKSCLELPRAQDYIAKYPKADVVICDHYQEVFNVKGQQNFRIQKQNPAMIIAQKQGKRVHPTPESFGIGGQNNYYFSHLLNCPYDCRYCFLQGMYSSAHFVWFINYEDIMDDIKEITKESGQAYFFSGYDGDSLALESQTQFIDSFLPFFRDLPQAYCELRTKSAQIKSLLNHSSAPNMICAFSLSPQIVIDHYEARTASLVKRLQAIEALAEKGWPIGLRLDPIIYFEGFEDAYSDMIKQLFKVIKPQQVHSVSVGPMRFPKSFYSKMKKLYPEERLFSQYMQNKGTTLTYSQPQEEALVGCVLAALKQAGIDSTQLFRCYV